MADPWFKADPRLWSAVADALPKPWPAEADGFGRKLGVPLLAETGELWRL